EVQRRDALGHARGMIDEWRKLNDAMPEADIFGALAGRREENFRRRRMRIFLEEVMLGSPHIVVTEAVGEFDLIKRVLEEFMFRITSPRTRELMLIETANLHSHLDARTLSYRSGIIGGFLGQMTGAVPSQS